MTKEEIIEMAIQAGLGMFLEHFAKLVAEKEREKCAEIAKWHQDMAAEIRARGQK